MRSFIRYLQNMVMILVISGAVFFPGTVSARGPITYIQPPAHTGGFSSDGIELVVADDFRVDETTRIGSITWWGYGLSFAPFMDDFKIRLYADSGGQPGAILQTFAVGAADSRVATGDWLLPPSPDGSFPGYPEFKYSYNLPTVFRAEAGTRYWLSIVNGTSREAWLWENSGVIGHPDFTVQRSYLSGPWTPYDPNVAFQLSGKIVDPLGP